MTLHSPCSLVPPITIVFVPLAIVPPGKIGVRIHSSNYARRKTHEGMPARSNPARFPHFPWPGFCGAYVATISVRCKSCLVHTTVTMGRLRLRLARLGLREQRVRLSFFW